SYVSDVVGCLARLGFDPDVDRQVFNLGPDEEFVTILHLAETIARLLRFDLSPIFVPGRPQEVHLATCSADKARARLGSAPRVTLEEGLGRQIEYIRGRGPRPFRYGVPLEIKNEHTPRTWSERLL